MFINVKKFPVEEEFILIGMNKILTGTQPYVDLNILWDSGWLKEVFPELEQMARFRSKSKSKNLWKHVLKVVENCPSDPVFRWAALFHDIGKPVVYSERKGKVTFAGHEVKGAEIWLDVAKRMYAPKKFTESVEVIIRESGAFVELKDENAKGILTDTAVRRYMRRVFPHLDNIFRFVMADMTTMWDKKIDKMKRETRDFMNRMDKITGADKVEAAKPRLPKGTGSLLMKEFGIKGKALGDMMSYLTKGLKEGKLSVEDNFVHIVKDVLNDIERQEYARFSFMENE